MMSSRIRLWLGFSLLGLSLVAGVLASGIWAARREAGLQAQAIHRVIEVHKLALRGSVDRYSYLPFTLAQHPQIIEVLRARRAEAVLTRANAYLQDINRHAGSLALYVMDVRGQTLASSNWDSPDSFVGENYANRPYFIDALAGRQGRFYGVGKTTGEPGLFFSAPVRHEGRVLGVVTVKISLQQIQDTWAQSGDPVMLSDARGVLFLGSEASWRYRATRPLTDQERDWLREHEVYGVVQDFPVLPWRTQPAQDHEGYLLISQIAGRSRVFLALDEPLPDMGWTLTVTKDYASVTAARNRTWALASLAAALMVVMGLYWRLLARRFGEQRQARRELEVRVLERTRELAEANAFRQAMEDSLPVGMRARDLAGRIIYVNPALCELTGYSAQELIGQLPPYPYWHPDEMEKHWAATETALAGGSAPTGLELRIRHRDGHDVYTMVYTAPLIDASGQHSGWMSSMVDITEQKLAEARQRQYDEQLQHTQRLASVGEMASTLAHELNQPLMALSNFASAAKAFATQNEHGLLIDSLDEIATQAQRAGDIVHRLRSFVRQRTAGAERCALNACVDNVLALLKAEVRHHRVQVRLQLAADLAEVQGDRVLLEQVLLNLILNSLQAMDGLPRARRLIEITTVNQPGGIRVSIRDHGPGMDAQAAQRVFEPFFTTRAEGLGLGLNICRTIIESHGGRLGFEQAADEGITFFFDLPRGP